LVEIAPGDIFLFWYFAQILDSRGITSHYMGNNPGIFFKFSTAVA